MKIIKFIPLLFYLILYNSNSLAETTKDCSTIKADTGVKIYEKWRCKMGKEKSEGLGTKLKKLFKKKS